MKKFSGLRNLKTKIWISFAAFAALVMVILWVVQIIFFNSFYYRMEMAEIRKIGDSIYKEYKYQRFDEPVYMRFYESGMPVRIFNRAGIEDNSSVLDLSEPDPLDMELIADRLFNSDIREICEIVEDKSVPGSSFLIYAAVIRDLSDSSKNGYIYVINPLGPLDSTSAVIKKQLVIVSFVSFLLAIAMSFFISSKISRSLTRITDTAMKLAGGNYDIVFDSDDYTEIDRLSNVLNYATKELSKTDRLKNDIMANISHDLRTPLTMIKAYAEMIRDISGSNEKKRSAHVQVIINEANRMSELVTDILDYSKIESGNEKYTFIEFDIYELTTEILEHFREAHSQNGFQFTFDARKGTTAIGDKKKIQRVIYNLIGNSINHSGDVKLIEITIIAIGNIVHVEIRDHGPGIPDKYIERIWDRYFTSDTFQKKPIVGTGLGLSIVRGILSDHNSRFGVKSTMGEGSTFWFELQSKGPAQ